MENLVQLISNVGFPIVCAVAMFYSMEREREAHKEESEKWTEALNRNTLVMEKVLERIDKNET